MQLLSSLTAIFYAEMDNDKLLKRKRIENTFFGLIPTTGRPNHVKLYSSQQIYYRHIDAQISSAWHGSLPKAAVTRTWKRAEAEVMNMKVHSFKSKGITPSKTPKISGHRTLPKYRDAT